MKQTSPILIGICAVLAVTTLGSLGYVFLGTGSDEAVASDAVASQQVTSAKVAVVDLAKVATELGRTDAMNRELKAHGVNLDGQLKEIQTKLQAQVTAKENEIKQVKQAGQQVTPKQERELVGLLNAANKQLNVQKQKAAIILEKQKKILVRQFRSEAIAVAKKVAKERGFDMVVAKHPDFVLSYDSSFDITDAVIDAMPAAKPVPAAAPEQPKREVASYNHQQPQQPAAQVAHQNNGSSYR